ncbi:MAG: rane protein involved in aromatic hydrocarbon degradation [bacterium]|nr:rane protein involved in aromatic hydrocarbon degradation [bacterium]
MRSCILVGLVIASFPRAASAGGIEIDEQSARATGTAGAQTAVANDPAAVFYNPAGLVDQPGFNALVGGSLIYTYTKAVTGVPPTVPTTATHVALLPTLFLSQRLGRHVALAAGLFTQWGEHFGWPTQWPGRFIGQFVDVTTATFDFSVSVRLLPFLSVGGGIDVIPGSADLYRAANFGGAEGSLHVGVDGTGVGGNVGALVDLVPRRLRLGFMYRSRVDLDLNGHGVISAPIELQALTGGRQIAKTTLILPHTLAVGLAVDPSHRLTLSVDARVTLWRDLQMLTVTLSDPAAPPGTPAQSLALPLQLHNSYALRFGGELRVLGGHLHLRAGIGYDSTPLPTERLGPLLPDAERVEFAAGIGWHERWIALDAAYMAVVLFKETANNPDLFGTYETQGHVITLSATVRIGGVGRRVRHEEPRPELPEEPPPRHSWQ